MRSRLVLSFAMLGALAAAGRASAQSYPGYNSPRPEPTLALYPQIEYDYAPHAGTLGLSLLGTKKLSADLGMMGATYVSKSYAEAYAGPALFLGRLTIGAGAGIESGSRRVRGAFVGDLDLTHTDETGIIVPINLLAYFEYGGATGPWARAEAMAYFAEMHLGLGAMGQSDEGIGPRLEIVPASWITLYDSVMSRWWRKEVVNVSGVRFNVN